MSHPSLVCAVNSCLRALRCSRAAIIEDFFSAARKSLLAHLHKNVAPVFRSSEAVRRNLSEEELVELTTSWLEARAPAPFMKSLKMLAWCLMHR